MTTILGIDPGDGAIAVLRPPQEGIALRDYQKRGVAEIRAAFKSGSSRICYCLPTGGGKTFLFAYIVAGAAARGKRVLLLAHRVELVEQISEALARQGVAHGLIVADAIETDHVVQIASVAALARRLDRWRNWFDLIIVDEAHHGVAASWAAMLAAQPSARVLGVTATPERRDGRGLGEIFEVLVEGPDVADLITNSYLAPFTIFTPADRPDLEGVRTRHGDYIAEDLRGAMGSLVIGAAVAEYRRICHGRRAIVFCVDRRHSRDVIAAFGSSGIAAAHVDGETPAKERRSILAAFARGEIDIISNVALFGEGVDIPAISAAILLRPTQSVGLYLQQVGRALRPSPGKDRALVLDFAGNSFRHGLPDAPRRWSLDAKARLMREHSAAPVVRRCQACGVVNAPAAFECANCGADIRTHAERREIAMQLAQRDPLAERIRRMNYPARLRWAGDDLDRLTAVARACGYRIGWIDCRLREMGSRAA